MGMPKIEVNFRQKAASAISRSAKGIVALIVRDATEGEGSVFHYNRNADVDIEKFTAENLLFIEQAFMGMPLKVIVIKTPTDATMTEIAKDLDTISFNWASFLSAAQKDQADLVDYAKNRNKVKKGKKVKILAYNPTISDDMHIVNFTNKRVKFKGKAEDDGWKALARLTGMLAGLPLSRSSTYFILEDMEWVEEPPDLDQEVDNGHFFLFNDEGLVRVASGVNSLKTLGSNITEDMKHIDIVEAMDLIEEDIFAEFKNWIGRYKNKYENQALFISAVNGYMKALEREEVLDDVFENQAFVNVERQRQAWIDSGKAEAVAWDDATVKEKTFKTSVFLAGSTKILGAMENLFFDIDLF